MYTLRIINKNGNQFNQNLGDNYHVIRKGQENFEEAKKPAVTNDNTFAVIIYNDGKDVFPLFSDNENYVMTDTGKTFEKL